MANSFHEKGSTTAGPATTAAVPKRWKDLTQRRCRAWTREFRALAKRSLKPRTFATKAHYPETRRCILLFLCGLLASA